MWLLCDVTRGTKIQLRYLAMAECPNSSDFSCDSSWSEATVNSEEDSSDNEQGVAHGAYIQPYQYEPEDGQPNG